MSEHEITVAGEALAVARHAHDRIDALRADTRHFAEALRAGWEPLRLRKVDRLTIRAVTITDTGNGPWSIMPTTDGRLESFDSRLFEAATLDEAVSKGEAYLRGGREQVLRGMDDG